tara:strand:- start:142 stop:324 length:183 start_codon:yes stop_codon:yes gene_type:complete
MFDQMSDSGIDPRDEMYEDRISDLETRVEMLERYVSDLRRTIDNIHPVQYNIVAKDDTNV